MGPRTTGDDNLRAVSLGGLLVAIPGRVSSDRRRMRENPWLSTLNSVLEDVASSIVL